MGRHEAGPRRRRWAYVPALGWAALLLWIGSRTSLPELPSAAVPIDKVAHFLAYGGLGALLGTAWRWSGRWPAAPLVVALGMLVGVADEINQASVPGRSSEFGDVLADAAGVLAGFWFGALWLRRRAPEDEE